ncbi:aKG-HExxH-type peptide beta-hydroxylase [Streptomyces sp. HMX87]|uniref:aKG-HExxH-type peptide beta-hydroxylase n=1 Tax=Streptomyces sp. HMX87 TaxID=3390849 RepID=UPI003A86FBE8
MLTRHRIPVGDLDDSATGRLTAPAVARIVAAERSRRLLMFRAVADAERQARFDDGPLPPVAEAFELLARAERSCPEVVGALLAHPPVGVWAVRILQRLRGGGDPDGEPPLWHELGYAHALAGAAALRGGLRATLRVPARSGTVPLPTLGQALFPGTRHHAYDVADLDVDGAPAAARLTLRGVSAPLPAGPDGPAVPAVPADPGAADRTAPSRPVWRPSQTLDWPAGTRAPGIRLEDTDPYRDFRAPHPPSALAGGAEPARWQRLLDEAAQVLERRHPHAARMVAAVLTTLVPLPAMPRFQTSSASYAEAFGSALLTLPQDGTDLAVTLVHEARHSVLNGLDHLVRLVEVPEPGRPEPLLYAPWRSDPRPLWGLLHGAYAFTGVAEFWRAERAALSGRTADLAHFEFASLRGALTEVCATLPARQGLTDWGQRLVGHLADQVARWAGDDVPRTALDQARAELVDLRATWRIRNLRPDPAACRRLTDRWMRGGAADRAAVPGPALRDRPLFDSPEPRGQLRRILLADGPAALRGTPEDTIPYHRDPGLLDIDRTLVRGEADDAVRQYRKVLTEDPACPPAWIGLGLALRATGRDRAARALLGRPEVVRAVALGTRSRTGRLPDPAELAEWLEGVPALFASDAYG